VEECSLYASSARSQIQKQTCQTSECHFCSSWPWWGEYHNVTVCSYYWYWWEDETDVNDVEMCLIFHTCTTESYANVRTDLAVSVCLHIRTWELLNFISLNLEKSSAVEDLCTVYCVLYTHIFLHTSVLYLSEHYITNPLVTLHLRRPDNNPWCFQKSAFFADIRILSSLSVTLTVYQLHSQFISYTHSLSDTLTVYQIHSQFIS
jgi:hypothetical protein